MTRRKLEKAPAKRVNPSRTLAALLAAVEKDTRDLDARAVYADALLDAGDPRGELIALQLRRDPGDTPTARERELLGASWKAWVGPLAPVLHRTQSKFERGFLHTAVINAYREGLPESLIERPEWSTVEVLVASGLGEFGHKDDAARLVERIGGLRELVVDDEALASIAQRVERHPLERLTVFLNHARLERVRALLDTKTFPGLRALGLTNHTPTSEHLKDCLESAGTLEELSVPARGERAAMTRLVRELAPRVDLFVTGRWGRARASLDGRAVRFTLVEVEPARLGALEMLLRELGDGVRVDVAPGPSLRSAARKLVSVGIPVG